PLLAISRRSVHSLLKRQYRGCSCQIPRFLTVPSPPGRGASSGQVAVRLLPARTLTEAPPFSVGMLTPLHEMAGKITGIVSHLQQVCQKQHEACRTHADEDIEPVTPAV